MYYKKGFTLIELLVVISIIGLLSSVVLASLDSARKKARTTQSVQNVRAYVTAAEMYRNDHGGYPNRGGGSGSWSCLGDDYVNNRCWYRGTSGSENSTLNNQFLEYMPSIPGVKELTKWGSSEYNGLYYRCMEYQDSKCDRYEMRYWLEGQNEDCGIGTRISTGYGTTYCRVYSTNI